MISSRNNTYLTLETKRAVYNKISTNKMVQTLPFGNAEVPIPGFGAMGLSFGLGSNLSYEEAEPVLLKALELGCTFWDTAVSLVPLRRCRS
jgi:hypothetical protein